FLCFDEEVSFRLRLTEIAEGCGPYLPRSHRHGILSRQRASDLFRFAVQLQALLQAALKALESGVVEVQGREESSDLEVARMFAEQRLTEWYALEAELTGLIEPARQPEQLGGFPGGFEIGARGRQVARVTADRLLCKLMRSS